MLRLRTIVVLTAIGYFVVTGAPVAHAGGACNVGEYSVDGNEPCDPCPAGSFQPSTGQTSCIPCATGTYQPAEGSASCFDCPGGQATPCNDNGTCDEGAGTGQCSCNVGYTGVACENGPTPCSPGYYSATGNTPCTPCDPGTAQPSSGQTTCTPCASGTFQPNAGAILCNACPGGQANPCNGNGTCDDGAGTGQCSCNVGYSGVACENGPPPSTTSTTLAELQCAPTPEVGCEDAVTTSLQVKNPGEPAKQQIKWKWSGTGFTYDDMGAPDSSTDYLLCVYDDVASTPALRDELVVLASPAWLPKGDSGWLYKDAGGSQGGVTMVSLKDTGSSRKVQIKGKGSGLSLPSAVGSEYFDQDPSVTVQLHKQGGSGSSFCLNATFGDGDTSRNDATQFKASVK